MLLKRSQEAKKGKRVSLKGQYPISTQEEVEAVEKVKREAEDKKKFKKRKQRTTNPGTGERKRRIVSTSSRYNN